MSSTQSESLRTLLFAEKAAQVGEILPVSLAEQREQFEAALSQGTLPPFTHIEPVTFDMLPAEWVSTPEATSDRVLFYLHGGSYIFGSRRSHRHLAARLSAATKSRVLVLEYRLAPEHPFPAAVEDSTSVYTALLMRGFVPSQIILCGDSAGGGLALATLLALKDSHVLLPKGVVLLSPWVDVTCMGASIITKAEHDPLLDVESLRHEAALYAGITPLDTPLLSPLYGNLEGFPPLLIQVGEDEILLDDSTRLAIRARAMGVPVELQIWSDMWHVWHLFAEDLPEGQHALEQIGVYVDQRYHV